LPTRINHPLLPQVQRGRRQQHRATAGVGADRGAEGRRGDRPRVADQAKKGHETATRMAFHEMLAFCQEQARRKMPVQVVVTWHSNGFPRADSIETSPYLPLFREAGVSRFLTAQKWIDFARGEDRLVFGVTQEATDHRYILDHARATARGRVAA